MAHSITNCPARIGSWNYKFKKRNRNGQKAEINKKEEKMTNRTLHVLLICKTMPWQFKGGIQTHTWQLAKALSAKGHAVSILSGGPFRSTERHTEKEGISLINIPYFPGRYIKPISYLAEEFSFNWAAKQWVAANHGSFDIIHAQGRSGYLLFMVKSVHQKLVNTVHGLVDLENQHSPWYGVNRKLHTFFTKHIEKRLLKCSKLNISVSKSLKKQVQTLRVNKPLKVISNGVATENSSAQVIAVKPARFLFVGRLHPVKGISAIVENMIHIQGEICLDIVGYGTEYEKIKRLIESNNLHNKVRLLGEYSNEKIHEVLPYYQALILPSQYETQGIVLLEANVHSIPVIASDIPAIRETVTSNYNGILCQPDQPAQFISAMEYMTQNPLKTKEMGRNGRAQVLKQYTWDQIAERTLSAYNKIAI